MSGLTAKERLTRIFEGRQTDRPSLKLWGAGRSGGRLLNKAYAPVAELAARTTDLWFGASAPCDIVCGADGARRSVVQTHTSSPLWDERVSRIATPLGELRMTERVSTVKRPGYITEYCVKEPADIKKLLSIPYEPYPVSAEGYKSELARAGEDGITVFSLPHAAYTVQSLMGSETFALFCMDERELLSELTAEYGARTMRFLTSAIDSGVRGAVFGWVGPELVIPPLVGYGEFEEFCMKYDKPLCGAIHASGGHVWVHCHGKVSKLIDRFIDMGVDVLNPLEPPKNGDVDMAELTRRRGGRIGFEGNIEIQDILLDEPEELRAKIRACVEAGAPSGRFILCQSAGYMEYPEPTEKYISNLMLYLREGLAEVGRCCNG